MAKVIFGPLIAEARGRQGNLVFSRGPFGAYTRPYVTPDETETTQRGVVWDRFAAACEAWNAALSNQQRIAWGEFAHLLNPSDVFGTRQDGPGRKAFISAFLYLDNLGLTTLTDPPPSTNRLVLDSATLDFNWAETTLAIDLTWPGIQAQPPVIIYATPPLNPAVTSPGHRFKQIAALPDDATFPFDLWNAYLAMHGWPEQGKRIFVWARPVHPTTGLPGGKLLCFQTDTGPEDAMQIFTRTLTPDEIKHLHGTPIQLLPAPGPGKAYVIDSSYWSYKYITTPYTVPPGYNLNLLTGTELAGTQASINPSGLIDMSEDYTTYNLYDLWGSHIPANWLDNLPLMVYNDDVTEYADGDGTLKITIFYAVITL